VQPLAIAASGRGSLNLSNFSAQVPAAVIK
jgi:hypothetical protein